MHRARKAYGLEIVEMAISGEVGFAPGGGPAVIFFAVYRNGSKSEPVSISRKSHPELFASIVKLLSLPSKLEHTSVDFYLEKSAPRKTPRKSIEW